ncbi:MAG: iron ABC transporter permease [Planctomycetota bacterium]|nr:MAG: iron ABC transporter permease [Planctomycetota bacterium]
MDLQEAKSQSQQQKEKLIFWFLLFLLPLSILLSFWTGPSLTWKDWSLWIQGYNSPRVETILFSLRLPRILFGVLVGASLAASGAALQGILQNPLAEPYTLGISGGGLFGVSLGIIAIAYHFASPQIMPFFGFGGSLLASLLVYLLAIKSGFQIYRLILGGVIISFIFSSLVIIILFLLPPEVSQVSLLMLIGDLSGNQVSLLWLASPIILIFLFYLFHLSSEINLLSLGEEKALSLGVSPKRLSFIVFWITSLLTGTAVSIAGLIGFIGLMVPHLFRLLGIADFKRLLPYSALGGAILLVLFDTLSRRIFFPLELPVGILSSLLGGLVLLYLLLFNSQKLVN